MERVPPNKEGEEVKVQSVTLPSIYLGNSSSGWLSSHNSLGSP